MILASNGPCHYQRPLDWGPTKQGFLLRIWLRPIVIYRYLQKRLDGSVFLCVTFYPFLIFIDKPMLTSHGSPSPSSPSLSVILAQAPPLRWSPRRRRSGPTTWPAPRTAASSTTANGTAEDSPSASTARTSTPPGSVCVCLCVCGDGGLMNPVVFPLHILKQGHDPWLGWKGIGFDPHYSATGLQPALPV